jgi:hypothetical protein
MALTLRSLLLLIAALLFLVDAFVNISGVSLIALGLALFAFAFVVPDTALTDGRGMRR